MISTTNIDILKKMSTLKEIAKSQPDKDSEPEYLVSSLMEAIK